MYPENSSFSPDLPTMQVHWDATSLSALKSCPYKYYLSIVLGYQPRKTSVHLVFGILVHEALEKYHKLRASGLSYVEALEVVMQEQYYRQLLTEAEVQRGQGYHELALPVGESAKTPHTLLRTIVWYLDLFESQEENTLETYILSSGKPAVELSFNFPLNEEYTYAGHFDRIATYNGQTWVTDYKTTKSQLNQNFFSQFSPSIQMTGYTLASQIVFDIPAKGVIVDGIQLAVTSSQFARQEVHRTASQLEEFLSDLKLDIDIARVYAEKDSWPLNPTACHFYGGCQFRKVCSHSPSVRANFLKADFKIKHWNPTQER